MLTEIPLRTGTCLLGLSLASKPTGDSASRCAWTCCLQAHNHKPTPRWNSLRLLNRKSKTSIQKRKAVDLHDPAFLRWPLSWRAGNVQGGQGRLGPSRTTPKATRGSPFFAPSPRWLGEAGSVEGSLIGASKSPVNFTLSKRLLKPCQNSTNALIMPRCYP